VAIGADGFGSPEHLAAVASDGDELGPELHDGWLYFNSARKGGPAKLSIYRAQRDGGGFSAPQPLPSPFNDGTLQGDFTLSPDGRVALFWSRRGDSDELDLFASCKAVKDWSPAVRLPGPLNAAGMDFTPAFSADGQALYFSSLRGADAAVDPDAVLNGQSNLYTVPAALVHAALAKQVACGTPSG
jgi:Tol biopolymer transport system component